MSNILIRSWISEIESGSPHIAIDGEPSPFEHVDGDVKIPNIFEVREERAVGAGYFDADYTGCCISRNYISRNS